MGQLEFESEETGRWKIASRGFVERTRDGAYFFGSNSAQNKWSESELKEILAFIEQQQKGKVSSS